MRIITSQSTRANTNTVLPVAQLRGQAVEGAGCERPAGADRDVLPSTGGAGNGETGDRRAEVDLPEHLTRFMVERPEPPVVIAAEDQSAAGDHQRAGGGALFVLSQEVAGLG